jgi:hypothetical protein
MNSAVRSKESSLVDEVKRISAITDPVIRNLRITECYHRLSVSVEKRTGPGANWCTFATWASKQAGQTIRGDDLIEKLSTQSSRDMAILHPVRSLWAWLVRRGLFRPETRLGRLVHEIHGPLDALELASNAVSRGNRKVFEKIGLEFARFLDQCPAEAGVDSEMFQSFRNSLQEGDPPDGQSLLRLAFERYQKQAADPGSRAQNLLLANLQIGFHEQIRLQPEIREAMTAGPYTADNQGRLAVRALFPDIRFKRPSRMIAALLRLPASRFQKYVNGLTCRIITEGLMVLSLPRDILLDLHRNLKFPFPESLTSVQDDALRQFLSLIEPSGNTVDDCGAVDWSVLSQRVHFIAHLFRAFQEKAELFDAPFTEEQVRELMTGSVPTGEI